MFKERERPLNLLKILSDHYPDHVFTKKYDEEKKIEILFIDGKYYAGNYTIMSEDINSYYAMDSEKQIIEMIGVDIERFKKINV